MIYLTVALLAVVGALGYQQYAFKKLLDADREQNARERARLLQRIQAPESAVAMHAQDEMDSPLVRHHVEFDDDKDFENYLTQLED